MTRPGDAAPERSQSAWVVRLHRDTTGIGAGSGADVDTTAVLAGPVVAHRGHAATGFGAVSIHRRLADQPLALTSDVLDLRCEPRDLPDSRNTEPATDMDHVVHVLCSRFSAPEAIEDFLGATRGLIDRFVTGREAWFEVLAHPTDAQGGTSDDPIVDDVFVARYPTVEAWQELHDWEPWKRAIEALEAEATTIFHLVVQPTINRLAALR